MEESKINLEKTQEFLEKIEKKLKDPKRELIKAINKLQRWELEWEWMSECEYGEYIKHSDLIELLKNY